MTNACCESYARSMSLIASFEEYGDRQSKGDETVHCLMGNGNIIVSVEKERTGKIYFY